MSWLGNLFGGDAAAKPIDAIGSAVDKIFTSDEERLTKAETMQRLQQELPQLTAQLDQLNAKSDDLFTKRGRPFCIYVAGLNALQLGIAVVWFDKTNIPEWFITMTTTGFLGALGIYGVLRSAEKIFNKTK